MKVAVTASGTRPEDPFDTRFGRAAYFIVYDLENGTWDSCSNSQNLEAAQGAGIQAAQNIHRLGVSALITGHVGPKAFRVLHANGISIYSGTAETAQLAFDAYKKGALNRMEAPDVEGHWA